VNRGDRVTVTVHGERVAATVIESVTALGNVQVRLDVPIVDPTGLRWTDVVRARDDVQPIVRPDPSRAYEPFPPQPWWRRHARLGPKAVNSAGEVVRLDTPAARLIADAYDVPHELVGIIDDPPTPRMPSWWARHRRWLTLRWWQSVWNGDSVRRQP
jgi:hypothetical protein